MMTTPAMAALARGSACHRCGAGADEPCKTPAGAKTTVHTARVNRAVAQWGTNR